MKFHRSFPLQMIGLLLSLSCGGVHATPAGHHNVIDFSQSDTIDKSGFAERDPHAPFYFKMQTSGASSAPHGFTVDKGSQFDVAIDKQVPPPLAGSPAARSLKISLFSDHDENVKDKVFFNALRGDAPDSLKVSGAGNERFVSFDLMLDKAYQTPQYWVIHFQAIQCCAGHPPFALRVIPEESNDSAIAMEIIVSSDASEAKSFGVPMQLAKFMIRRGTWNHFVFDLKPSPCGAAGDAGKVGAWLNKKPLVNWAGCWGYAPTNYNAVEKGKMNGDIAFDIGIYRRRQPTQQTIYIDRFAVGHSRQDIDF